MTLQSTQPIFRKRSSVPQPTISQDLLHTIKGCEYVSSILSLDNTTIVSELIPLLQSYKNPSTSTQTVITAALLEIAQSHTSSIDKSQLRSTLRTVFLTPHEYIDLNELISSLTLEGIDAEGLTWAIIGVESHRHINLIWHEANKLTNAYAPYLPPDMLGWGWRGLRAALRNFNPAMGNRFSTYACIRISGAIRDGIRAEGPIPKRLTTLVRQVAKADEHLAQVQGRIPSLAEVADELGRTVDEMNILSRLQTPASVDEVSVSGFSSLHNVLVGKENTTDLAISSVLLGDIDEALAQIPKEEADAVRLLVLEGASPKHAREITGASARQMRQRKEKGLLHIKSLLNQWEPSNL